LVAYLGATPSGEESTRRAFTPRTGQNRAESERPLSSPKSPAGQTIPPNRLEVSLKRRHPGKWVVESGIGDKKHLPGCCPCWFPSPGWYSDVKVNLFRAAARALECRAFNDEGKHMSKLLPVLNTSQGCQESNEGKHIVKIAARAQEHTAECYSGSRGNTSIQSYCPCWNTSPVGIEPVSSRAAFARLCLR
jgi:hypothetical protein